MAYTALASLRQSLEKITLFQDQNTLSPHHNKLIRSIYEQVLFLQQSAGHSREKANFLESKLRYVSCEAEGVIDHFISEKIRSRFRLSKCIVLVAKFGKSKTNFKKQLKKIREEVDLVARELMEMEKNGNVTDELRVSNSLPRNPWSPAITEGEVEMEVMNSTSIGSRVSNSLPRNPWSPAITEGEVEMEVMNSTTIGSQVSDLSSRESSSRVAQSSKIKSIDSSGEDLLAIKTRLCGGWSKLQVIPIVGMGGIGKTTLARNVYDDPFTVHYFDIRVWVTVSQDYSTQRIISGLVDSMEQSLKKKSGQGDEEAVYKGLKGSRYLIVMDDVWSTNAWDDVRNIFPDDHNGSRILLTTRLSDVAAYFDSSSPVHQMRFMSNEQSWELIRQRVLEDENFCPELERLGMKIAESCRGLPLAVVLIAGLLSTVEKKADSWWEIAKNVSSIVVREDGQFDEILWMSYTHLPHHLRSCFLYLGGFPEDYEIRSSKLIKLWAADSFLVQSEGSSKSLEEEAEECLEDLANRNLVLVTKRKTNGRIKSCSLHDLIRDLCIRKAQESNFFHNLISRRVEKEAYMVKIVETMNRISIISPPLKLLSCPNIHTILCFYYANLNVLKIFKLLRVLDAENAEIQSLPNELFELIDLRYLAMRFQFRFTIPAAISKLRNLQTLIIVARNRWELVGRPDVNYLPQEIWMMPQLRHLICYGRMHHPKDTTSTLENLLTLSLVVLHEGILEKIRNLKKLGIDCSHYDHGTHLNNLEYLHQLENLELCYADWRKDSVCFPRMLRKLTLRNMSLPWSDMSVVGSLPNLQVLKLRELACIGRTWETSEGEFGELQYLLIETSKLEHWITESEHFPRLKYLLLHECWYLDEIPECFGESVTLELIEIKTKNHNSVTESLAESARKIQEEQQSLGNDALQVRYPSGRVLG